MKCDTPHDCSCERKFGYQACRANAGPTPQASPEAKLKRT